eukprot:jgi/Mesvir1/5342/Mv15430-RA.2
MERKRYERVFMLWALVYCSPLATNATSEVGTDAETIFQQAQDLRRGAGGVAEKLAAVELLASVAERGHRESLRALAEMYELGEGVRRDVAEARRLYERAADLGDAEAQAALAFMLLQDTGLEQHRPQDVPKALLYLFFSARAGNSMASLAMGYRHLHGRGVQQSCKAAALYYRPVAEQVVAQYEPAWSRPLRSGVLRLAAEEQQPASATREEDLAQYYQYSADMGHVGAQSAIGKMFKWGVKGLPRDYAQALHYFGRAAQQGDADAAAFLGHMHANGLGVPPNNDTALEYFFQAANQGQSAALFGLGYMLLLGYGLERDEAKAVGYFSTAAERGSADAHYLMGMMYMEGLGGLKVDKAKTFYHMSIASHQGHMHALYTLGVLHLTGQGVPESCSKGVSLLKTVAEWGAEASGTNARAHALFRRGDHGAALSLFWRAAEMGYEAAESNAAYMLERGLGVASSKEDALRSALALHERAAVQGHTHALLQIGDAYFYGRGTRVDREKAAVVYRQVGTGRARLVLFEPLVRQLKLIGRRPRWSIAMWVVVALVPFLQH